MPRQPTSAIRASDDQIRQMKLWVRKLEAMGFTRKAIAEAAGLNPSTITRLCAGQTPTPARVTIQAVLSVRPNLRF
jgi:hypothetical protein